MAKKDKWCQYERRDGEPCPHKYFGTFTDPETGERTDYCIFHALIELKNTETDKKRFWVASENLFKWANDEYNKAETEEEKDRIWLDCEGFVFHGTGDTFSGREFPLNVTFAKTTFVGEADFRETTFSRTANFSSATFAGGMYLSGANFKKATFKGEANFKGAVFEGAAMFLEATFAGEAGFDWTKFRGWANFGQAAFSSKADFPRAKFEGEADFGSTTFGDKANFRGAIFAGKAAFYETTFENWAIFDKAIFEGETGFRAAVFKSDANFTFTIFKEEAHFGGAAFVGEAEFTEATFNNEVNFGLAKFEGKAEFVKVLFEGGVSFYYSTFNSVVTFFLTTFKRKTDFMGGVFADIATFGKTMIEGETNFAGAIFEGEVYFWNTELTETLNFQQVKFVNPVSFKGAETSGALVFPETSFSEDADFRDIKMYAENEDGTRKGPGKILFDNAFFHQPERVQLGGVKTDLGQWSFKDTNIEKVNFVNEEWKPKRRRRGEYIPVKISKSKWWSFLQRQGRKVIYDEIVANEDKDKQEERRVTWEDAGQVYRRLRKKFEGELAYELTSDFHYGQMECRRLDNSRKWWDRWILTAGYTLLSDYGKSITRPLFWLGVIILVCAGAYLLTGFDVTYGDPAVTKYVKWAWFTNFNIIGSGAGHWWSELWFGVVYSIRGALSLKFDSGNNIYLPMIAAIEKALSAVVITFFVLALRWKFKR